MGILHLASVLLGRSQSLEVLSGRLGLSPCRYFYGSMDTSEYVDMVDSCILFLLLLPLTSRGCHGDGTRDTLSTGSDTSTCLCHLYNCHCMETSLMGDWTCSLGSHVGHFGRLSAVDTTDRLSKHGAWMRPDENVKQTANARVLPLPFTRAKRKPCQAGKSILASMMLFETRGSWKLRTVYFNSNCRTPKLARVL